MTDATGRCFLSYKRERRAEAEGLRAALWELGVPTWQDVENLNEEPIVAELEQVLAGPEVASAVLWLTPEVAGSPAMLRVEAPAMLRRHRQGDGFFFVACPAGGLGYEEAGALVNPHLGAVDLQSFLMRKLDHDPATDGELRQVAERVLRRRLAAVHRQLAAGEPLRLRLMTRQAPGCELGWALTLDWHHHFQLDGGRRASPEVWQKRLLPALETVKRVLRQEAPGRRLELSGLPALPAAMALGATFLSVDRDFQLAWRQFTTGQADQLWSLDAPREAAGFEVREVAGVAGGEDLALLLSVTRDAEPAFARYKAKLSLAATLTVRPPQPPNSKGFQAFHFTTPGQVVDVARLTIEALRATASRRHAGRIHVFAVIPAGLAMLLGQLLNTLGPVQTYEHIQSDAVGHYEPAVLLQPG